ncbi:MAG: ABC transporter permease [Ignavibacteriae bacterium]|nr:ABC transporter permease [Ignavibacteriota bacterium]
MFRLLIEKELREIIGSTKFAVSFGVCSILILLAFYLGAANYLASVAQYNAARAENLRQLEGLTDWLAVRDYRIFLPPRPLTTLVSGIANDVGRTIEINGRGDLVAHDSRYGDEPIYAIFRFLDLDFVFQIVLSLFAIVFAYDSINGEKERGTLRLTFANAVPKAHYILAKLIGSYAALAVPLLIPLALGSLLLVVMGIPLSSNEWMRLGVIIATGIAYVGVFLTLSILLSSLTQRSSTSFLMLLVIWVMSVIIVPRGAVLLAGRAVSVPTIEENNAKKGKLNAQLWREDREAMTKFQPSSSSDPQRMASEFQKLMQEMADKRDARMKQLSDRLNEERTNAQQVQRGLAFGIARVSPAATFALATTALAGTSLDLEYLFRDAALAYQQAYAGFMFKKTGVNLSRGMIIMRTESGDPEKPKSINANELPVFTYSERGVSEVMQAVLPDIGLLLLYNVLFFAGAFVAFLRYDLR